MHYLPQGLRRTIVLSALALLPAGALSQADGSAKTANPPTHYVDLKVQNADIQQVFKQLFRDADENYVLAQTVQGTITASLTHVPFRTALESVIRSAATSTPLTYRVENGAYIIEPSNKPNTPVPTSEASLRLMKIALNFGSVPDIVSQLRTLPMFAPGSGVTIEPHTPDNTILATGSDDKLEELRSAVRLLDVQPQQIMIKAEAILVMSDPAGHKHRSVFDLMGRTLNNQPVEMKTSAGGGAISPSDITLGSGGNTVRVHPRVNGDGTITLTADWALDYAWNTPKGAPIFQFHDTFTGTLRGRSGETMVLNGSTIKLGSGKSDSADLEVLLFFTPTLVDSEHPTGEINPGSGSKPETPRP